MSEEELRALCIQITTEKDPQKFRLLIEEMLALLKSEQEGIRADVQKSIAQHVGEID